MWASKLVMSSRDGARGAGGLRGARCSSSARRWRSTQRLYRGGEEPLFDQGLSNNRRTEETDARRLINASPEDRQQITARRGCRGSTLQPSIHAFSAFSVSGVSLLSHPCPFSIAVDAHVSQQLVLVRGRVSDHKLQPRVLEKNSPSR